MSSVSFRCPNCRASFESSNTPGNLSAICPYCNRVMRWFYAHNNQKYGPLLFAQLSQLASSGSIEPTDWVFQEGSANWIAARDVPGLMSAAGAAGRPEVGLDLPTLTHGSLPALAARVGNKPKPAEALRHGPAPSRRPRPRPDATQNRNAGKFVLIGAGLTVAVVAIVAAYVISTDPGSGPSGSDPTANNNANPGAKPADAPPVPVVQDPGNRVKMSGQELYKKAVHATVWILTHKGSGTGALIDGEKRLIITNMHVVPVVNNEFGQPVDAPVTVYFPLVKDGSVVKEKEYYTRFPAEAAPVSGKVVYRDLVKDLAIVQVDKLPAGAKVVTLSKTSAEPGEMVHAIGNTGASGSLFSHTSGSVRNVYQKNWTSGPMGQPVYNLSAKVVETQVPANPGDSGGPVLNEYGELIGVTQGFSAGVVGISFAIDVSEVHNIVNNFKKNFMAVGPVP